MNDNLRANLNRKSDHDIDKITDLRTLDQKIKEGERLLTEAQSNRISGFLPLIGSLAIVIAMGMKIPRGGLPYVLLTFLALLYLCFNVWRIYSADKRFRQRESKLKAYRVRKKKLQSQPPIIKE